MVGTMVDKKEARERHNGEFSTRARKRMRYIESGGEVYHKKEKEW